MIALDGLPAPTAIEPSRVLVLDESQQRDLLAAVAAWMEGPLGDEIYSVLAYGEEYNNEVDELARTWLRKRRLEAEVRRCNARIEQLDPTVVDQLTEQGLSKVGHDATGATLKIDTEIWVKLDVDTDGMNRDETATARAAVKAQAGAIMRRDPELKDFVREIREDFNLSTVSAYLREQIKQARAAELAKPEHERRPVIAEDFIPQALRGLLRIDDKPTIQVRAGGS